jgi:glycosyltransferase involved in cell wall biosynthesis
MPPWGTSAPASTSSTVGYSVTDQSATDQSLRVSVDATSLLDRRTGVGAMASALVSGLAARPDVRLSLFAVSWRGRGGLAAVAPPGATIRRLPVPARLARAAWARTDHPTARLLGGRAEVVHGPNFVVPPGGGAVEVVTVHDLTAVHHPEMCTPDVLEWPGLLRRALRRGAWVHTVSEFVAAEVRDVFPEAGHRVVAVPNGVDPPPATSPASDASAGHHLVGGTRYVLAIGTVEPRKDLPGLVDAFDLLAPADPDLRLVIAGGDGPASGSLDAAIAASPHRDRVVRVGFVDDHRRGALLRGATVLAYPSRYEGFGLVPLEAMAAGTPVVATKVGAIPEVVGDAAHLVAPGDPASLARGLQQVIADDALRETLIDEGFERVQQFRWDASVEGIVALYRRALAER